MKALVTGATGFAGQHLAAHLLSEGYEVLGVSRTARWPARAPDAIRAIPLLAWDIAQDPPEGLVERVAAFAPDWVFHLAALSVPADCGRDEPTAEARAVNVDGTRRVVELARRLPGPVRLLFVSTSHVYAPVTRDHFLVNESSPIAPTAGYGKTKLLGESLVAAAAAAGLDAVIVRAFQHAGPGQSARMMLAEWGAQFAAGGDEPVRIQRSNAFIDLSDVRDVVRAYRLVAQRGDAGQIYNVGSGQCLRSGDVFEHLRRLAAPQRLFVESSPAVKQDPIADISRVTAATAWRPRIDWRKTVEDVWKSVGAVTGAGGP